MSWIYSPLLPGGAQQESGGGPPPSTPTKGVSTVSTLLQPRSLVR